MSGGHIKRVSKEDNDKRRIAQLEKKVRDLEEKVEKLAQKLNQFK